MTDHNTATRDFVYRTWPLKHLKIMRASHKLKYRNDRAYDYALANAKRSTIPECIERWQMHGLTLSSQFVMQLWHDTADKRGHDEGELGRTTKLVLDAFRQVYDIAAMTELATLAVAYSEKADRQGCDYRIRTTNGLRTGLELSLDASERDFRPIKADRRRRRGDPNIDQVLQLRVGSADIDREHQPWVPTDNWYRHLSHGIEQHLLGRRTA